MPILKLHLENIGPFDKLELDLTDGNGKAHLGPHILAGVNGSGKSTVLRAIAASLAIGGVANSGFDEFEWEAFVGDRYANVRIPVLGHTELSWNNLPEGVLMNKRAIESLGCIAAYAPRPVLRRIAQPPTGYQSGLRENSLAFEQSVTNEGVQSFWIHAFLREAVLKNGERAKHAVKALRQVVSQTLGEEFQPGINVDESFAQPVVRFRGNEVTFSQLAAGISATLGWTVDYLLRRESFPWPNGVSAENGPGLIMIDEIETHLHPQWQRRILNGIRAAFPNTQIIVTTHSPFVVSSCTGARLHLFKLDDSGKSSLDESIDAPDSASISANIMDVFGIRSEFSLSIEQKLDRWNDLKRRRSTGRLSAEETSELKSLIDELAAKGEELSSIVAEPPVLPQSIIDELVSCVNKHR